MKNTLHIRKLDRVTPYSLTMRSFRLLFLSLILASSAQAETRVFVSLAGTLLEAEITAVSGDNVTLKRSSDAQSITINRRTLCKEDSAYIARWRDQHQDAATAPPPSPLTPAPAASTSAALVQKYRLVCQTLPTKVSRGTSGSNFRVFELTYSFNLSNQEVTRDLQNARGMVITLGKRADQANGDLIVLQKEEFDVNIRAQSKTVHSTQPVRLSYYQETDEAYGVKNYGYVLIIRDAAGNILLVEANPDASARFTKEILALTQVPCVVDREFRVNSREQVPLSSISF